MPINGGNNSAPFSSTKVIRQNDQAKPPLTINTSGAKTASNNDLPAVNGTIVNNVGTLVSYNGAGFYNVAKNGGTSGSYDADAVSTGTLTGDIEVILEYSGNVFVAGLNPNVPTANSTFATSIVGVYMDGGLTALYSFGSQVGSAHTQQNFAKLTYTQVDDTFRYYTSNDGVSWGAPLESLSGGGLGTTLYFDSSIRDSGVAFNVAFRTFEPLTPSLFSNTNTFFTPTVSATYPLTPSLFTNTNTIFTPAVKWDQTLTPSLFTNSNTFFSPTVTATYTLSPSLFTNTNTFFTPTVSSVKNLTPSLFTNTQSFFSPAVTATYSLTPSLFTNTNTFFSATVSTTYTLSPALFTNSNAFFTPTISQTGGLQTLTPSLFTNTNTFYSPVVVLGPAPQFLLPPIYSNASTFYGTKVSYFDPANPLEFRIGRPFAIRHRIPRRR